MIQLRLIRSSVGFRIVDATRPTIDLIEHRMNFEARRHAAA
jgi:hypothetical protein